jgi:hypothetical protein
MNRMELVDFLEDVKHVGENGDQDTQEKAAAVIKSGAYLIQYYDKHGWPED